MSDAPKQPVTLRRIAREAGVSVATASRALNRPETVSAETRDRVLAVVEHHRYVPDALAASFSSRRSGLIGLVVPTISNSIYAAFTEAVQTRLQSEGRKLLIANTGYDADVERDILLKLVQSRVEGVILTGYRREERLYELLRHYRIPFVVTWSTSLDPATPAISFDNEAASESAMQALLDRGHRRIGLVCGVTAVNDRAAQRLSAYRRMMERHGVPFDPALVQERVFEVDEGATAAEILMRLQPRPTALFCANDIQALGALFACQRLGLDVPGDVSIIGFDDLPISRAVNPSLTTVHVPAQEMGDAAAARLVSHVKEGCPIEPLLLPTELVIRASIGPVKAGSDTVNGTRTHHQ